MSTPTVTATCTVIATRRTALDTSTASVSARTTSWSQNHLAGTCRSTWPARWRGHDTIISVHAVEVHRAAEELQGEPELAVCGAVVAVTEHSWADLGAGDDDGLRHQDRCPACLLLIQA